MSCGGSVCSFFSDIVTNGSIFNGSCLYFFLVMVVFVSLGVNLLFLAVSLYLFRELWCYNVCSLYPRRFLQVYHYHYILLYALCLWNVCKKCVSFWFVISVVCIIFIAVLVIFFFLYLNY